MELIMNKIFKLSLTLFVIVAGTLLLLAGAGGVRYVGNFTGNGAGLTNVPQSGVVQLSNSLYYLTNAAVASTNRLTNIVDVTDGVQITGWATFNPTPGVAVWQIERVGNDLTVTEAAGGKTFIFYTSGAVGAANFIGTHTGNGAAVTNSAGISMNSLISTNETRNVTFLGGSNRVNNLWSDNLNFSGTLSANALVVTNPPALNLQSSTNLFEKNVVVQTNTWGNQVVDFSRGTLVHTNLAGNLTLTGISGFALSNYNWMTVELNPNGATRTLTVPAEWYVNIGTTITNGFTNATVGAIPDGTWAQLQMTAIIGVRTAAVLNILQ